jgi:hypothetical protein
LQNCDNSTALSTSPLDFINTTTLLLNEEQELALIEEFKKKLDDVAKKWSFY